MAPFSGWWVLSSDWLEFTGVLPVPAGVLFHVCYPRHLDPPSLRCLDTSKSVIHWSLPLHSLCIPCCHPTVLIEQHRCYWADTKSTDIYYLSTTVSLTANRSLSVLWISFVLQENRIKYNWMVQHREVDSSLHFWTFRFSQRSTLSKWSTAFVSAVCIPVSGDSYFRTARISLSIFSFYIILCLTVLCLLSPIFKCNRVTWRESVSEPCSPEQKLCPWLAGTCCLCWLGLAAKELLDILLIPPPHIYSH